MKALNKSILDLPEHAKDSIARLRWRCRRGARELDLLLLRFLERDYPHSNARERSLFETLLDEADPDLYAWISGQAQPDNPDYLPIIGKINNCSSTDPTNVIVDRPAPAGSKPGDYPLSSARDVMKINER